MRPTEATAQSIERIQQLSTRDQLSEEVDIAGAVEGSDELDDERMVQLRQNIPLMCQRFLLLLLHLLAIAHQVIKERSH